MPMLKMTSGAVYETSSYTYDQLKNMVASRQDEPWVEVIDHNGVGQPTVLVNLNEVESLEHSPNDPQPPA